MEGGIIMAIKGLVNQDSFLKHLRKDQILVTIHLLNGFQFRGLIKAFDSFVVIIEVDKKQVLIYKHAISTISPSKYIEIAEPVSYDSIDY